MRREKDIIGLDGVERGRQRDEKVKGGDKRWVSRKGEALGSR